MKINETIRMRRKEQGMTQEQVAAGLGVSTSAVHKWEKGTSYPDITLLPALARLLRVDLNTLLSFQDDLTPEEIGRFCDEIVQIVREQGYNAGFQMAIEKMREYPTSDLLLSMAAGTLDGALILFAPDQRERYEPELEALYRRAAQSETAKISDHAKFMLVSKLMERQDYEGAQELLEGLAEPSFDRNAMQAELYQKQGKLSEAAELWERKLLSAANECYTSLLGMMEIALEEKNGNLAETLAGVAERTVHLYGLWEYSAHVASFQLAVARQDAAQCVSILKKMLPALQNRWAVSSSPLYRHIKEKEGSEGLQEQWLNMVLTALQTDEELVFLRADTEFKDLIESYEYNQPTHKKYSFRQ